jgi:hypothetical protein
MLNTSVSLDHYFYWQLSFARYYRLVYLRNVAQCDRPHPRNISDDQPYMWDKINPCRTNVFCLSWRPIQWRAQTSVDVKVVLLPKSLIVSVCFLFYLCSVKLLWSSRGNLRLYFKKNVSNTLFSRTTCTSPTLKCRKRIKPLQQVSSRLTNKLTVIS